MDEDRLSGRALTVIVVDDHAAFRAAARSLLETGGFEVVAEASTAGEALEIAPRQRADLVLLDVRLPDMPGWQAAERLRDLAPHTQIVLVSSLASADVLARLRPGIARGFLAKHELSAPALRDMMGMP